MSDSARRWLRVLGAIPVYAQLSVRGALVPRLQPSRPVVVARAVVLAEDGLLLAVRSDLQGWELPGGTLEVGEAPEAALHREVREETGLELAVERHVGDYRATGFWPHLARVYRCRVSGGRLRRSFEHRKLAWFDPEALPETLFPWLATPIADALVGQGSPVERQEHHGWREIAQGLRIDLRMRLEGEGGFGVKPREGS